MATKSGQQEPEKAEVIEELLDALDTTVDRVRVLYEQYFLGIQKQPPTYLHTDIERKIRELAQLQIRNTALRYRFATLQQKFGSYNSYWRRTLRQIENGTYSRNLSKIGRQAAKTGAAVPEEILAAMPKRMREQVLRDREAALALSRLRERPAQPADDDVVTLSDGDFELESEDLDPAAFIEEPSELRRNMLARAENRVEEADGEFDVDAFFASVAKDDAPSISSIQRAEARKRGASRSPGERRRGSRQPPVDPASRADSGLRPLPRAITAERARAAAAAAAAAAEEAAQAAARWADSGMRAVPAADSTSELPTALRAPARPRPEDETRAGRTAASDATSELPTGLRAPSRATPDSAANLTSALPAVVRAPAAPDAAGHRPAARAAAPEGTGQQPSTMRPPGSPDAAASHPAARAAGPGPLPSIRVPGSPDAVAGRPTTRADAPDAPGPLPSTMRPPGAAGTEAAGRTAAAPPTNAARPASAGVPPASPRPGIPAMPSVPRAPADPARPAVPAPSQAAKPLRFMPGAAAAQAPQPVETLAGPFPRIPSPPPIGASRPIATPPVPSAAAAPPPPGEPAVPSPERPAAARPPATPPRPPPPIPDRSGARPPPRPRPPERDPAEPRQSPPPGMSDADVNALYAKYVKAKQVLGEETEPGAYGKLLKTINAQAPKIMAQYKAKGVDFSVVVKDNQVIIRAKPKP